MNEAKNLKELFNRLKVENGISRAKFCRNHTLRNGSNLNTTLVNQHINGIRPISIDYAYAYANAFGLPLQDISPSVYEKAHQSATHEKASDDDLSNVIRIYKTLSSENKKLILGMCKSLSGEIAVKRKSSLVPKRFLSSSGEQNDNDDKQYKDAG